jgi:benzodiazapine receptor
MKLNYILIPLITLMVGFAGNALTDTGLKKWYKALKLPSIIPPGPEIGIIWSLIFILSATSALVVWNSPKALPEDLLFIGIMFMINALMNVFWSFLFFYMHMLSLAAIESAGLALTVLALIFYISPISTIAAVLLIPYFLWACFATFLTFRIWQLNK